MVGSEVIRVTRPFSNAFREHATSRNGSHSVSRLHLSPVRQPRRWRPHWAVVVRRPCTVRRMKRTVGLAFRTKTVQFAGAATISGPGV